MKQVSVIVSIFTAIMVMLTSNGIVYEYYFCKCCNEEHTEVSLFEFGEVSHNHHCHEHHGEHKCNCHCKHCHCHDKSEHAKHTHVIFMSLKDLFYGAPHVSLPTITTIEIIQNNYLSLLHNYDNQMANLTLAEQTAVPTGTSGAVCQLLSCFRL